MTLIRTFVLTLLLLACAVVSFAQSEQAVKSTAPPDKTVTISISAKGVRFAALGSSGQMRLEVFNASGASLYNSEFKAGNVRDWALEDNLGQPLLDGIYQCVITLRDLSGRLSLKQGTVALQSGQASLQLSEGAQAGAVEPDKVLAPVSDGKETAVTLVTHDGKDGQVVSTQGSLTFKLGDFFAGRDKELMRLTADGKLGLGVSDPQAKLDVAGPIRTSEGVVFPDGTVQTTAYLASGRSLGERSRLQQRDAQGRSITDQGDKSEPSLRFAPSVSGTGTTNRLTKWIDGPNGVVGDTSSLTEIGGSFGLGRTPDSFRLDLLSIGRYASRFVSQTGTSDLFNIYNNTGGNLLFGLESSTGNSIFSGTSAYSAVIGHDNARSLHLATNNIVRQTINSSGNVGIGTTTPATPLEVNGLLRSTRNGVAAQYIQLWGGDSASIRLTGQSTAGAEKPLLIQNLSGEATPGGFNTIQFQVGTTAAPSTKMIINKDGTVGIGTTTPDAGVKLHAEGGSTSTGVFGTSTLYTGVYGESISGRGVRGESTSSDGVYGTSSSGSGVRGEGNGSSGVGVYGTNSSTGYAVIGISTSGFGVYGSSTSGVGVYGSSSSTSPAIYGSNLNGGYAGYFEGNVYTTGVLTQNSDARLKRDVTRLSYGLREVLLLRPVSWAWKAKSDGAVNLGLIAQEVEPLLPELVSTGIDAEHTKGINYIGLIPVLVKGVQEQQTQIEQQKAQIEQLHQQLQQQQGVIESLRKFVCGKTPQAEVCR